jgi:hypothetical protein
LIPPAWLDIRIRRDYEFPIIEGSNLLAEDPRGAEQSYVLAQIREQERLAKIREQERVTESHTQNPDILAVIRGQYQVPNLPGLLSEDIRGYPLKPQHFDGGLLAQDARIAVGQNPIIPQHEDGGLLAQDALTTTLTPVKGFLPFYYDNPEKSCNYMSVEGYWVHNPCAPKGYEQMRVWQLLEQSIWEMRILPDLESVWNSAWCRLAEEKIENLTRFHRALRYRMRNRPVCLAPQLRYQQTCPAGLTAWKVEHFKYGKTPANVSACPVRVGPAYCDASESYREARKNALHAGNVIFAFLDLAGLHGTPAMPNRAQINKWYILAEIESNMRGLMRGYDLWNRIWCRLAGLSPEALYKFRDGLRMVAYVQPNWLTQWRYDYLVSLFPDSQDVINARSVKHTDWKGTVYGNWPF